MGNFTPLTITHGLAQTYLRDEKADDRVKDFRQKAWDFSLGFPFPAFTMQCPVCGVSSALGGIQVRHWKFHRHSSRTGSKHPERVDISFKCRACANVWTHGVKCPKALYEWIDHVMYQFREVDDIIANGRMHDYVIADIRTEATKIYDQ